jgi:hypothetical protein
LHSKQSKKEKHTNKSSQTPTPTELTYDTQTDIFIKLERNTTREKKKVRNMG